MSERVLVIAAHPDDELLGCGGVVAKHAAAGDTVHTLIVAEGATSRSPRRDARDHSPELARLRDAAARAAAVVGAEPPTFGLLPDNRLDSIDLLDVVKVVEDMVERVRPAIVYTHHGADLNVDHRVVHAAVLTACRPLPGSGVRAIYAFETVSSTEWASAALGEAFRPTRYVDVSPYLERKLKALACYDMEMRTPPHARSLENVAALARMRGMSVGVAAAEAFVVLREVVR